MAGISAILLRSATFQALTMMRRESGLVLSVWITSLIWSMCPPSGVGQLRHCTPYTGPSFAVLRAPTRPRCHAAPLSQLLLLEPVRNHNSSTMMDLRCTFLVVTSGKPSFRSNRIWCPNTLLVPVPVRSASPPLG